MWIYVSININLMKGALSLKTSSTVVLIHNDLVSVNPSYNKFEFLQAIESVLNQTYKILKLSS